MADSEDSKPQIKEAKGEHINIKVVGQDQNEVHFKIKRQTQLKRLMEAYCERQGKPLESVRFLFDGERVQPTQTPEDLGMEDQDTIDVMVMQVGGGSGVCL